METEDGRFRLMLSAEGDKIRITVEALGGAIEALAGRRLGIAGPGGEEELVAIVELDEDGDGSAEVDDRPEIRQALLQPVIGLIEDAEPRW